MPWHTSRAEIDVYFPDDYREFVDRYGGGSIMQERSWVEFFVYAPSSVPRAPGGLAGFPALVNKQISARRLFVFDGADEGYWGGRVYPMYPDPGGLFVGRGPGG